MSEVFDPEDLDHGGDEFELWHDDSMSPRTPTLPGDESVRTAALNFVDPEDWD